MVFQLNSQGKVYLAIMNNLPKHHGAGPNAAASVASA